MMLPELIDRMADIQGVEWIRLHYAYPTQFPYDILPVMASRDNVCSYLDIALQHISDKVLTNMRRHITRQETLDLLARLRREVPGIHIRTTLMVGFPSEGEQEFEELMPDTVICTSATPGDYELERCGEVVEQIIRPTGLLDPIIEVRPTMGQVFDLISEINTRAANGFRTLVTTLTKKMAEDLTEYMESLGMRVRYLHHDIDTVERMEIIRDLRLGEFDTLIGINLLREGLDIPEVSLVAILDADKEGFLRSETSLIQTIGRAARNAEGTVIMYADSVTPSMERAITETARRRAIQMKYNEEHGITPKTIIKKVADVIEITQHDDNGSVKKNGKKLTKSEREHLINELTKQMKQAAKLLDFEQAAYLRDRIKELEGK